MLCMQRVETEHYGTTRQFLHDTEWILHNCIIYNGGMSHSPLVCGVMVPHVPAAKHALTKIAKGIVKVCKEDVSTHTDTHETLYHMTSLIIFRCVRLSCAPVATS